MSLRPAKASGKHIASIAKAFAGDIGACKALKDLARAPLSDAEKYLQKVLTKWELTFDVPITYLDISDNCRIPILKPSDYIQKLCEKGFLNKLLGGSFETCTLQASNISFIGNLGDSVLSYLVFAVFKLQTMHL